MLKTRILLILLAFFLFVGKGLKAQGTFAPIGAEWWYEGDNYEFIPYIPVYPVHRKWVDHVSSISDTIVSGTACRHLTVNRYERSGNNPESLYHSDSQSLYIYDNIDTVFVFNERFQRFTPLYIFNAEAGDTICLTAFKGGWDSAFCYIVDSVSMVDYDGHLLRTVYTRVPFQDTIRYSYNWGRVLEIPGSGLTQFYDLGKYVERLGGLGYPTTGLFPTLTFNSPDATFNMEGPVGKFKCYQDNEIEIKFFGENCDDVPYPYKVGIDAGPIFASPIHVYPNPASQTFTLKTVTEFPLHTKVLLTDLLGKQVSVLPSPQGKREVAYDISHLPSGIYIIKLQLGGSNYFYKLLVD